MKNTLHCVSGRLCFSEPDCDVVIVRRMKKRVVKKVAIMTTMMTTASSYRMGISPMTRARWRKRYARCFLSPLRVFIKIKPTLAGFNDNFSLLASILAYWQAKLLMSSFALSSTSHFEMFVNQITQNG